MNAFGNTLTALIQEGLARGRTVSVRARGASMRPLIPDGSIVDIVPAKRSPRVGDVVAAAKGDRLFIHRVVALDGNIHLQGDGSPYRDEPFQREQILGFLQQVTTPRGWIVRLDTPMAALLGTVIARVSRARAVGIRAKP